ncbi:MAG: SH3 domain-containing protein [Planctomycetota bacterium]
MGPLVGRVLPVLTLLVVAGFASATAPLPAAEFPALAEVTGSRVRVRTGASFNDFPIHTLAKGSQVVVDGLEGDWYRIHIPPYVPCWIHTDYLTARPDGSYAVRGTRVRVRGTPGTQHSPIGVVEEGVVVRATGERDKSGQWVQCYGPAGAMVHIHKDFVVLREPVAAAQVASLVRALQPTTPAAEEVATGTQPDPSGSKAEAGPKIARLTPRLAELYERFQAERQKPPLDWNLAPFLSELDRIRRTTEDLGEVDSAERWIQWIDEQLLPIQNEIKQLEREKALARGSVPAPGESSDRIKRAGSQHPPDAKKGFLATGWVVALGDSRRVVATHKLVKGNELLFYIKSDQFDLNRFVNKMVGIQGVLAELPPELGAREITVTSIQVLSN